MSLRCVACEHLGVSRRQPAGRRLESEVTPPGCEVTAGSRRKQLLTVDGLPCGECLHKRQEGLQSDDPPPPSLHLLPPLAPRVLFMLIHQSSLWRGEKREGILMVLCGKKTRRLFAHQFELKNRREVGFTPPRPCLNAKVSIVQKKP